MNRQKSILRLIVEPMAIAIVLAMVTRSALRMYTIPSASMAPTLVVGDHILVTPYHAPFPDAGPERGDVIVFRSPLDQDELLVKRVIGVPGDLVDTSGGRVRVGAHTLDEPYLTKPATSGSIHAQIVPASSYFVMGDNRDNSFDSRNWGTLPHDLVVGRVRMVLWSSGDGSSEPSAHASTLSRALLAPSGAVRFDRILKVLRKAALVN